MSQKWHKNTWKSQELKQEKPGEHYYLCLCSLLRDFILMNRKEQKKITNIDSCYASNMFDACPRHVICYIFEGLNFIKFVLAWAGESESVRNWEKEIASDYL